MNVFDEREKAFEAKYQLDQETAFKVNVRRDKLLGLWVAGKIGLSGSAAEEYARSVIEADFAEPGDDDVVRKILADLANRKVELSEHDVRLEMHRLTAVARQQVLTEAGK